MSNRMKISPENDPLFYIGHETIAELLVFLRDNEVDNVVLVSDENEYRALGARVENALIDAGLNVNNIILYGEEIGADEKYIVQTLLPSDDSEQLFIAVGSGTVTDIVRFVSFRAKSYFISMPTAPSVDGFASNGSAMTIQGYKQTIISRPPLAIFADLGTLCDAPRELIASGFGDMFGKYTALADWKIAHIINGDPFDQGIADRSRAARNKVAGQLDRLTKDWEDSIRTVMEALYEEGLCMLEFGNSRPASGSEHQFSHYWEMALLREGRPAVFHGAKVGLASIWIAKYYEMISKMSIDKAAEQIRKIEKYNPAQEVKRIKEGYGEKIAPFIIKNQEKHLNRTLRDYSHIQEKVIDSWDDIQGIAAEVPSSIELKKMLKKAGGATEPDDIGLSMADLRNAMEYAQYVRTAFTILNICQMLGLRPIL